MARESDVERRRFKRHRVSLDAQIRVPLPEHGSAILVLKVTVEDLSPKGAKVRVHSLKRQHMPVLLRTRRKCMLAFTIPGFTGESLFHGEVVWVALYADSKPPFAHLGIELMEAVADGFDRLAGFLDTLERQSETTPTGASY